MENITQESISPETVIDENADLDAHFDTAKKTIQSKQKVKSSVNNLLTNPSLLSDAQKFMQCNPQIARRSESLKAEGTKHVGSMSNRKKNQLAKLKNMGDKSVPVDKICTIKTVKIPHGKLNFVLTTLPNDYKDDGWTSLQLTDDYFIFYDQRLKSKNKFVTNILAKTENDIKIGGDVYFCRVENKKMVDAKVEEVKWIFSCINDRK
jgi:hypothetical protein